MMRARFSRTASASRALHAAWQREFRRPSFRPFQPSAPGMCPLSPCTERYYLIARLQDFVQVMLTYYVAQTGERDLIDGD